MSVTDHLQVLSLLQEEDVEPKLIFDILQDIPNDALYEFRDEFGINLIQHCLAIAIRRNMLDVVKSILPLMSQADVSAQFMVIEMGGFYDGEYTDAIAYIVMTLKDNDMLQTLIQKIDDPQRWCHSYSLTRPSQITTLIKQTTNLTTLKILLHAIDNPYLINKQIDERQDNAVLHACHRAHIEKVKIYIEHRIGFDAENHTTGATALSVTQARHLDAMQPNFSETSEGDREQRKAMYGYIRKCYDLFEVPSEYSNESTIRMRTKTLLQDLPLQTSNCKGYTILHHAVSLRCVPMVEVLAQAHLNILQRKIPDFISLQLACKIFPMLPVCYGRVLQFLHDVPNDEFAVATVEGKSVSDLAVNEINDENGRREVDVAIISMLVRYEKLRNAFVDNCNGFEGVQTPSPLRDYLG